MKRLSTFGQPPHLQEDVAVWALIVMGSYMISLSGFDHRMIVVGVFTLYMLIRLCGLWVERKVSDRLVTMGWRVSSPVNEMLDTIDKFNKVLKELKKVTKCE